MHLGKKFCVHAYKDENGSKSIVSNNKPDDGYWIDIDNCCSTPSQPRRSYQGDGYRKTQPGVLHTDCVLASSDHQHLPR